MCLNGFKFDIISTVFQLLLKLHSHILVLWHFFRISLISEITESLYFWIYRVQMHVDLFFNHYFNFLSIKTEVNKQKKSRLSLTNLEEPKSLERQKLAHD